MSQSALFALVVTAISLLFSACVGLLAFGASLAVPALIMWFVYRLLRDGKRTVIIAESAGQRQVPAVSPPTPPAPQFVKRTRCRSCGAPKVQRSLYAYVYCDFCGLLVDWDFQACLADKRSRLPGPTYEALLRSLGPKLSAAKAVNDRDAYRAAQLTLWDAYATACPAALPPRVGDPAFRKRLVAWQAASQTDLDFDPGVAAAFERQNAAVATLAWDRRNPFKPVIQPGSFDVLLDAVLGLQQTSTDQLEAGGWLERHPDHPTAELFRHIGISALVQGWIPFFQDGETDRILQKTGLKGEYDQVTAQKLVSGPCPSCGAALEVVEGAKRVLCVACGHLAGVGSGSLACHGCGAMVQLPEQGSLFACPHCEAELRMMRHG